MDQLAHTPSNQLITPAALQQFLSQHPLLGRLQADEIQELAEQLDILELPAGEILFRQGDLGNSLFLVLEGSLEASIQADGGVRTVVGRLRSGDIVGEVLFLTGQRRTATITATESTHLAHLTNQSFARLTERYPSLMQELGKMVLPRLRHTQLVGVLSALFGEIDMPAFQDIEDRLVWKRLHAGEILFRQGDPADALYIVISGRLRIVARDGERGERFIGEIGRGDFTGEFGLITNEPRSATVAAVRETEVVQLSQQLFEHLWASHAPAMLQFTRMIVQRVGRFNEARSDRHARSSTIVVVPIHPSVPIEPFCDRLFDALAHQGTALHLSSRSFDDQYNRAGAAQTGEDHPGDVFIQGWLEEKETQHEYVLYQADPTVTPWTMRCLRQADRILLVGQANNSPSPGEIEQAIAGLNLMARQDLALLQPDTIPCASNTMLWLAPRQIGAHYHVRPGFPRDFQRLARRLAGKATGLVFSGGGARGWAHVGALQAIEAAGLEIDLIGGTSMGSLIGGAYAMGLSISEIIQFAITFSDPHKLLDYTLPFSSLTASRKVTNLMRHIFGEVQIEDACLPFFCVSSNLTRAEPMIHRTGSLWKSVRASIAIPGVFSPMPIGNDVLVDGGIINNFPIDIMRELVEEGTVIGVNASPKQERYKDFSFGPSVSGWQILWKKIFPFGQRQKAPSIASSLLRATEINSLYQLRFLREKADLIIEPPVSQFGSLEFARYQDIIDIGYQDAKEKIKSFLTI